jgi:carnitine O-acetyltransferase
MPLTFDREDSLPKLPLPDVQSSVLQALEALKPMVSDQDFHKIVKNAESFVTSDQSKILQSHLKKLYDSNNNYLNSEGISSTTSNVYGDLRGQTLPRNPFFILEDDPMKNFAPSQEYRAAVLTTSTLRFIVALKQGFLKSDINPYTKDPLTMSSYNNLFGTTVIPLNNGIGIKKSFNSKHMVFMSNGQFYSLTVLSENDQIWFSKHELSAIIKKIIHDSKIQKSNYNVGTFTSESKSTWKMARLALEKSNPKQMDLIDSALFIVALDHEKFDIKNDSDSKIQLVTHGTSRIDKDGFQFGTCINRYYDKLNLVVTKNATAACIYPASIIDGTTVLRFISDVYTDSVLRLARMINGKNYTLWTEINTVPINNEIIKPNYQHINFNLTNEISNGLHLAESRLGDIINQHEYVSKKINMGKNYIKDKMKLPTDSFVQICIQITYYALYGKCPSTFEPVSTRKFRDSRTEPICIQNETLLDLCQSFISQTTDFEIWKLLLEAIKKHKETSKNASLGLGFERHLSALRSAFIQRKILNKLNPDIKPIENNSIPSFIFDPLLENLYKPELIAANCGNPALDYFGITPSIPSGFGFGYIIKDDYITIVGSSQWRQTHRFLDTLERVFLHIKEIWKNVVINTNTSRDKELQTYISSIPMSMVTSNNSNWLPSFSPSSSTAATVATESVGPRSTTDAYIMGGYDYFDVEQLNFRSEMASKVQSRVISRVNSQVNLGKSPSFKNINTAHNETPPTVGRLLSLQSDF